MHRVKGLEFDQVVIEGLTEEAMPWKTQVLRSEDAAVRRDAELMERALLYVALTRARRAVLVTAVGGGDGLGHGYRPQGRVRIGGPVTVLITPAQSSSP